MNKCFQGVFTKEKELNNIEPVKRQTILSNIVMNEQKILRMLESLDVRKALGPDGVSNWILKEYRHQLEDKLHNMIMCSVRKGKIPREWKQATIVPIYKGGSKEDPLNYRPLSGTNVVGKLCERIIRERWMAYLERNEIVSER